MNISLGFELTYSFSLIFCFLNLSVIVKPFTLLRNFGAYIVINNIHDLLPNVSNGLALKTSISVIDISRFLNMVYLFCGMSM